MSLFSRHFRHSHTLAEQRLLSMSPGGTNNEPSLSQEASERAPVEPRSFEGLNSEQTAERIGDEAARRQESTTTSANESRDLILNAEQVKYDELLQRVESGKESRSEIERHVSDRNRVGNPPDDPSLHSMGLHVSFANGRGRISTLREGPPQNPELVSLRQELKQLNAQIVRMERGFNNIDRDFRVQQMRVNNTRAKNLTGGRQMLAAAEFSRLQPQLNDLMGLKNRHDQVQRQIDMLIGMPFDPNAGQNQGVGSVDNPNRTGVGAGENTRFDLDNGVSSLEPAAVRTAVEQLPSETQGPVARTLNAIPEEQRETIVPALTAFDQLPRNVQQDVLNRLPVSATKTPALPETQKFLDSLTPDQKKAFDGIATESRRTPERSGGLNEKQRQGVLNLLKGLSGKNENDRLIIQGTLLMMGVDPEQSNAEKGEVRMTQDNLRGIMAIVGLVQVLMGISGKFKNIGKEKKAETTNSKKPVTELTDEGRDREIKTAESDIKDSKVKEKSLDETIEGLEKDIDKNPKDEAIAVKKDKLDQAKNELKKAIKDRQKLEKRLEELKDAKSKAGETKTTLPPS